MIGPKRSRPSAAQEREAYELATTRDESVCVRCRRGAVVQRDHRQNRQPGNTVASNLHLLCPSCHQWKSEHPHAALRAGYSVPRWAVPSEWPGRRWVPTNIGTLEQVWALYDDEGRWERITDVRAVLLMEGAA